MSFFKSFGIITGYPLKGKKYNFLDITQRDNTLKSIRDNNTFYFNYTVNDGETPEVLADRIYSDVSLYWVMMLYNERHDVNTDWPVSQLALSRFITREYGAGNENAPHHYESIATNAWVDVDWLSYDKRTVTNTEYETDLNDAKREIKVLLPEYVGVFVSQHQTRTRG
jgi:hypothetical protein